MKHRIGFLVLSLVIGFSRPHAARAVTFEAVLLGSNEVPGPGLADGNALALVVVDGTQVTVSIEPRGFAGLTAVHIHKGRAGVAGALVAEFPLSVLPEGCLPRFSTATLSFSGSLSVARAADLVAKPQNYYVHVHTQSFPAGACRGQLQPRLQTDASHPVVPPARPPMDSQSGTPQLLLPVDCPAVQRFSLAKTPPDLEPRPSGLGERDQTITFASPPPMTYGDPDFRLDASASSELPLTFTAWGDCANNGLYLHILGAGDCWVEAQQPGDSNFAAAPIVDRQFSIAKADQTISLPGIGDGGLPAGFVIILSVSASSGLPVDITAQGACIFSRVTSTLSGLGAGSCTVTAQQPGDTNFNPAPSVTQTFPIITVFELD
jgi:hypothetical protein